jgi:hypothetical protein
VAQGVDLSSSPEFKSRVQVQHHSKTESMSVLAAGP